MFGNGLIRRLGLTSKFMTTHTGQPIITRQIISNISKSKDNQSMKFSQVIEYNVRNVFLSKNDPERLDPDLFQFF